jgi:uncharacterized protein (TIGR03083 family)
MPEPIQLLEAQSAATRQIVQSLSDTDLAKDSPGCPGWTLKDVVAHLATGAQMFEAIARESTPQPGPARKLSATRPQVSDQANAK